MTPRSDSLDIRLRPASPADLALLRAWDRQPHVVAGKGDEDWEWESALAEDPPWREQLIAEVGGRPVGFLQIIDPALEETGYWGAIQPNLRALDIWIGEPDWVGKGLGTEMMRAAITRCFDDPTVEAILVDPLAANTRAHRFYERLGFRFVEPRTFDGDNCHIYRLVREDFAATRTTT